MKQNESAVLNAPPTVKPVSGQYLDRDEKMHIVWIQDWDFYKGNLRILYTTTPSLEQFSLPDWRFYVYVVVATPGGKVTQHLITSRQASDHGALALRRGYDELFFQRHVAQADQPTFFERWSVTDQRRLNSVEVTGAKIEVNGQVYHAAGFAVPTSDGNFMFSATYIDARRQETDAQRLVQTVSR